MRLELPRSSSAIAMFCALPCAIPLAGQTKIDVRTQTKSIDFSGATATKPAKMGTSLPSTCGQGEFFFLSSAPAGQNVYGCQAGNVWSLEGAAVPQYSLVPAELNNAGKLLTTDGNNPIWQTIAGDVSGAPSALTVGALRGKTLSTVPPVDGQLLKFNGTTNVWEAVALAGDIHGNPATVTVSGLQGRGLSTVAPVDGQLLKFNGTTGFWGPIALGGDVSGQPTTLSVSGLQGRPLSTVPPVDGQLLKFNGTTNVWEAIALAGDIHGNPATTTVSGLEGHPLSTVPPVDGQLLKFNGTTNVWEAIALAGDIHGNPATATVSGLEGHPLSTVPPVDGQLLKFNGTTNVWEAIALAGDIHGNPATTTVSGLQGHAISTTAPVDGQLLKFNGTTGSWGPIALGGDVTGSPATLTVSGLQGRVVSSALPTTGQLLSWSAVNSTWTPTTLQVPPNYGGGFSNLTTLTILGTQHNLNTSNLLVSCYDNAAPVNLIEPSHVTIDPVTYNVTITFATPQSGKCLVNGSGGVGMGATSLTGSATLAFPAINATSCSAELTISVPGALTTDGVAEGWPALPTGFTGMMRVSAGSTVAVRICNFSGATVTPPSLTYGATIVRPF